MTAPETDAAPAATRFTRAQLEDAILGARIGLSGQDVTEQAGISRDDARRLWRSLGFPDVGDDLAFTAADREALSLVLGSVASGAIDLDTAVRLTRAVGQTMARLADWQVATLTTRVEQLESGEEATGSRIGSALRMVDEVGVPFEQLLVYAWRRHLAAAVARVEALGAADVDLHTAQVTVGFADLVAFTAMSNDVDDDELADVVEVFESRCSDVVAARGGRIIKTLGDSVLFVCESVTDALAIAQGIVEVIGRDKRLPDVRLGLATGSVVTRLGDVFGPPVNMAARLTSVARRNRIVVDEATARLLPAEDFDPRPMPPRPLRGFGVVEPYAVRRH